MIVKDEILIRQGSPIPLLEYIGPIDLNDSYQKTPPYDYYFLDNTGSKVRDVFFVEVSAYETIRSDPHAGIAEYRGGRICRGHSSEEV
jgi:hypothetical protein